VTTDILALADRLWRGEARTSEFHPVGHLGGMAEICEDVAFLPAFANVTAIRTADGLVLVDTGSVFAAQEIHSQLRRWTDQRLHTAVYSHGHIDHVFGVALTGTSLRLATTRSSTSASSGSADCAGRRSTGTQTALTRMS
jgi:metal-dependent hydrolase (beta-lactamase superfamily II)